MRPIGRAAQAAVCKTAEVGATPAWDSISFTRRERPVLGHDLTGLAVVVQLHPHAANGLQALQRCSGIKPRKMSVQIYREHQQ